MKTLRLLNYHIILILLCTACQQNAQPPKPIVKHVVFVGFDGLGAYAISKAEMPNLKGLMESGAYSLKARTVLPSSSAVNWASMLMGAGPTFHGFTEWGSELPEIEPAITTEGGFFPSIFSVIRDQHPEAVTAAVYNWPGIAYIIEKETISHVLPGQDGEVTADIASDVIKSHKPMFSFVHFSEPDGVGHGIGHDTPEYYEELKNVDLRLGKILGAINEAGISNETVIIISSDHGGTGKGHGGKSLAEIEIPFIMNGPGVSKGKILDESIITYDLAPTVALMLGLETPRVWRGKPVAGSFE